MSEAARQFARKSSAKAFDLRHREVVAACISRYEDAVLVSKEQFSNLRLARERAGFHRHFVLEHLEEHLKMFAKNFESNGGHVLWAETAADACSAILEFFRKNDVKRVVKSKSLVAQEIGLNHFLERNGISCTETGLGEFILQHTGEGSSHMMYPAMHLSAGDIAGIFHEKFGLAENAGPEEISAFIRTYLQEEFLKADAGITGADFLIADTGSVALTGNGGSGVMSLSLPRIHVVVAGIEKLLASVYDLDLFWPLLASHGTGQKISSFNSIVSGPRLPNEQDGPDQMVVVLVDNGRSRLLSAVPQRRALACIGCGACLSACPVFRTAGGHSYGTLYGGPIGAVVSPFMQHDFEEYQHLSFASTLCGKCTEVCPVSVPLHHLLIMNRKHSVKNGYTGRGERFVMGAFRFFMKKRWRLDMFSPGTKNYIFRKFFGKKWGDRRDIPLVVKGFGGRREGRRD